MVNRQMIKMVKTKISNVVLGANFQIPLKHKYNLINVLLIVASEVDNIFLKSAHNGLKQSEQTQNTIRHDKI